MRIRTYRDKTRSRHVDLIGGGPTPGQMTVALTATGVLMLGFACALTALWVH